MNKVSEPMTLRYITIGISHKIDHLRERDVRNK